MMFNLVIESGKVIIEIPFFCNFSDVFYSPESSVLFTLIKPFFIHILWLYALAPNSGYLFSSNLEDLSVGCIIATETQTESAYHIKGLLCDF